MNNSNYCQLCDGFYSPQHACFNPKPIDLDNIKTRLMKIYTKLDIYKALDRRADLPATFVAASDHDATVRELEQANRELVAQANKILDEKTSLTFQMMEVTSKSESMQRFHDSLVKQLQKAQAAYSEIQESKLSAALAEIERLDKHNIDHARFCDNLDKERVEMIAKLQAEIERNKEVFLVNIKDVTDENSVLKAEKGELEKKLEFMNQNCISLGLHDSRILDLEDMVVSEMETNKLLTAKLKQCKEAGCNVEE